MSETHGTDSVAIGVTGLGHRCLGNRGTLDQLLKMETADIVAVCDLGEKNRDTARAIVEDRSGHTPACYADHGELVTHDGLDAVVITTPWHLQIPQSITAMRAGVDCAMEVGPANSLEECHELVRVAERTGQKCMLLENFCYTKWNMTMILMARKGLFGELVHAQSGYGHELRERYATGREFTERPGSAGAGTVSKYIEPGEQSHGVSSGELAGAMGMAHRYRNGDLYPTHGLGPVAKCMDINRGNRILSLTATASKAVGMSDWVERRHEGEITDSESRFTATIDENHPAVDVDWRCGDVITTVIRCANGETILLKYNTTLPGGAGGVLQGTRGSCGLGWNPDSVHLDNDDRGTFEEFYDDYTHPLWERYEEVGVEEGHGGGDYLVLKSFVESVRRDVTPPINVYDAALWRSIAPLSEKSIALGSNPVEVPDFTNGGWMANDRIFGRTDDADGVLSSNDIL